MTKLTPREGNENAAKKHHSSRDDSVGVYRPRSDKLPFSRNPPMPKMAELAQPSETLVAPSVSVPEDQPTHQSFLASRGIRDGSASASARLGGMRDYGTSGEVGDVDTDSCNDMPSVEMGALRPSPRCALCGESEAAPSTIRGRATQGPGASKFQGYTGVR